MGMRKSRALVVAAAVVLGTALPAAAQTTDTTPPPVSTDTTLPPVSTDTTLPPVTTDTTLPATTATTAPTPTIPPAPPLDPDLPPVSVPVNDVPVPDATVPPGALAGAVPPPRAQVVQVDVGTARVSALVREAAYAAAVLQRQALEGALARIQVQLDGLDGQSRDAVKNLTDAHDALVARAVSAYVRGGGEEEKLAAGGDSSGEREVLLSAVANRDQAVVARYKDAQAQATSNEAKTAQDLSSTQTALDLARVNEVQALADLNTAQFDLAVTTAGGNIVVHGFVFPVASPHSFTSDFGAPRTGHTHQGVDIVAAEGTELFAAERGIVTQVSSDGLGGNGLWLKGESGTYYYYAHLSAYVLGLTAGQLVEAGQLVGYVGHTGDATGPHLHFEVHPNGGPAIDPYPILLAADPQQHPPAQP